MKSSTLNHHYELALILARAILLDLQFHSLSSGGIAHIFLVNYDLLFQNFVSEILKKFTDLDFEFTPPIHYASWRDHKEIIHNRTIEPDIVFGLDTRENKAIAIIDVKNKYYGELGNYLAATDIYQVFFYTKLLNAEKTILVYPLDRYRDNFVLNFDSEKEPIKIHAIFLNLAHETAKDMYMEMKRFTDSIQELL